LASGSRVGRALGRWRLTGSARTPGGYIYAWVELNPAGEIMKTGPAPTIVRWTNIVRERMRQAASRHLGSDAAGLLSGLVTGDTRGLSEQRERQLDDAGLSHLVAVSGANVG
jgi:predicted membrane metal-binding protein